jgi:outer membrane lipoprotein SlyB
VQPLIDLSNLCFRVGILLFLVGLALIPWGATFVNGEQTSFNTTSKKENGDVQYGNIQSVRKVSTEVSSQSQYGNIQSVGKVGKGISSQ